MIHAEYQRFLQTLDNETDSRAFVKQVASMKVRKSQGGFATANRLTPVSLKTIEQKTYDGGFK